MPSPRPFRLRACFAAGREEKQRPEAAGRTRHSLMSALRSEGMRA